MPIFASATRITSMSSAGSSDSDRYPCAIVPPNGPAFAASGSTWIHWWSPVASANWLTRSCSTFTHGLEPRSRSSLDASSAKVSSVAIRLCRLSRRCAQGLPAGAHHPGHHPGRGRSGREPVAQLGEQLVGVPAPVADEQLARVPALEDVHRAAVDEE